MKHSYSNVHYQDIQSIRQNLSVLEYVLWDLVLQRLTRRRGVRANLFS